jgi:hypothetical protein
MKRIKNPHIQTHINLKINDCLHSLLFLNSKGPSLMSLKLKEIQEFQSFNFPNPKLKLEKKFQNQKMK